MLFRVGLLVLARGTVSSRSGRSEGRPKKSDWLVFSALLLVGFLKIGLVLDLKTCFK